jgi:hypothetical protein
MWLDKFTFTFYHKVSGAKKYAVIQLTKSSIVPWRMVRNTPKGNNYDGTCREKDKHINTETVHLTDKHTNINCSFFIAFHLGWTSGYLRGCFYPSNLICP